MPQETNLNVSPYFDDFDADKNYHKVLFKPGYPVQARELTTLQSILQNQIENFGSWAFKEGSLVIPGQLKYDSPLPCVEVNSEFNGIPVSLYFNDELLGVKLRGSTSGVLAEVVYILNENESDRNNNTVYVRYLESGGENFDVKTFSDGETILVESQVTLGGITFQSGQGIFSAITSNATSQGSSVSIADGVYFIRGNFVNVFSQRILLDQYGTRPSYKVGFDVLESIVTYNEDETLYDNAQGFSNQGAPGADRFKIELFLSKKEITETSLDGFVEILRVTDGGLEYLNNNPQYNILRQELAKRTNDSSGDFYVKPFTLNVRDSLNDKVLNNGLYFGDQVTVEGNNPSEDLMVYQIGAGKAYVDGYDVETLSSKFLDVQKPRTTQNVNNVNIPYNAGLLLTLNNSFGAPSIGLGTDASISLMNERIGETAYVATGTTIGFARIYDFVPESNYVDDTSRLSLRLFDIQTFTQIGLTTSITLSTPAFIEGKQSRATGYLQTSATNSDILTLYQVSGSFIQNEQITINGNDDGRLIKTVTDYSISDVKSVYSSVGITTFNADAILDTKTLIAPLGTQFFVTPASGGISTVSSGVGTSFIKLIKANDIISYVDSTSASDPIYNKVVSVSAAGTNFTISGITTVSGVCDGKLPTSSITVSNIIKVSSATLNRENSSLLTKINSDNISDIDLENNEILQRRVFSNVSFTGGSLTIPTTGNLEADIFFASFDEDRFVIVYEDGSIEPMNRTKYSLDVSGKLLTFNGLSKTSGTANVISTVKNVKPDSKLKKLNKASTLVVSKSKSTSSGIGTTTLNDGLTYSSIYGLRVQDKQISLNVPDVVRVLAIYESSGTGDPSLPQLQLTGFSGPQNSNADLIIGERIVGANSGAVGLVVSRNSTDKVDFVYLNLFQFVEGEVITGQDSGVTASITNISLGDKNVTQNYLLDDGQRDTIYDYGRIIRKNGVEDPTRRLKIVFQNYTIDSTDTGEFITVKSYEESDYKYDIPTFQKTRLSDFIDIRPRVVNYSDSNTLSPFEFSTRNFLTAGQSSQYILAPDENILLSYSYYLGRIDKVFLNPDGTFEVVQGTPSNFPKPPLPKSSGLEIATVSLPPYLFDTSNAKVIMSKHKRYQMADISSLEDRILRLEEFTSLTALESKTENFTIKDAATGLDRFKSGFFVDNFSTHKYHDVGNPTFRSSIDSTTNTLRPQHYTTSIDLQLGSEVISGIGQTLYANRDYSFVSDLGSSNIKKTGDLITLNYEEVKYIEQTYATGTESVTPYLVKYWNGIIQLTPPFDTWVDEVSLTSNRFREITNTLPPPSNINNTVVRNVTNNQVVNVPAPTSSTSAGTPPIDWIANAKSIFNNAANQKLFFRYGSNGTPGGFGNTLITDNFIQLRVGYGEQVLGNEGDTSDRSGIGSINETKRLINQLLPPDIARDFITQIDRMNANHQYAFIQFNPAEYFGTSRQTTSNTTTTTSSASSTNSFVVPPQITTTDNLSSSVSHYTETVEFLRSRNIEFDIKGLKPRTKFNTFFSGVDVNSYIIPKLLEVRMISGTFQIGETVESDPNFVSNKIVFRLCKPNHKFGSYDGTNLPGVKSETFAFNPYTQQPFENVYSSSSTILNVDTKSLQLQSETSFYGSISRNMKLIGRSSGAVAIVSEVRLVSDFTGRLIGSLYIPDPNVPGNPQFINGKNTFIVSDTTTLNQPLSNEIIPNQVVSESSGSTDFTSQGTKNITETNVLTTRNVTIIPSYTVTTTTITNTTTNTTTNTPQSNGVIIREVQDPLAQTFYVQEPNGIFLTSVDIFFENKSDSLPVTLQIRTVESGAPSNVVIPFSEVTLDADDISLSEDGTIATRFTFPSPVYLRGPQEQEVRKAPIASNTSQQYAIVLLSDDPNYRVFISTLQQIDLVTGERVSVQPTLGSLFKSQNGSTWTPSQLQDLKYTCYRADFDSEGLVRFFNPLLDLKNQGVEVVSENSFLPLSKKIVVGLGSTGYDSINVVPGVTITQGSATATLTAIGGSIAVGSGIGVTVSNAGTGYTNGTFTSVSLITETGYGQGATATIGVVNSGIATVNIINGGNNYAVGDALLIPNIGQDVGFGGRLTVTSIGSSNAFMLDNVQGQFVSGITTLSYKNSSGITTFVGAAVTISSIVQDQYYTGTHMKVFQPNHGMHSSQNYVKISGFRPLISSTNSRLGIALSSTDSTSLTLSTGTGAGFTSFEGLPVSATNIGYVIIGNEVVGYTTVTSDVLTGLTRGVDGTQNQSYDANTYVYKYEFNGVSLRRINKVHNFAEVGITTHPIDINSYHINIDMADTDFDSNTIGKDRSNDLYFSRTIQSGESGTVLSKNIQFESVLPNINHILPSNTTINGRIRTYSGTSIGSTDGSQPSFVDQGYEDIDFTSFKFFDSPRIIGSQENENRLITNSPGNRSLTLEFVMRTNDSRLSPVLDTLGMSLITSTNLLNNPTLDYSTDETVRSLFDDQHTAIYISKPISLKIPANSLKVLLTARRHFSNDVRVLYQLFRDDAPEASQNFELFPGFSNYYVDGNGVKQVIDPSNNDGSADTFAEETSDQSFKDYEYSIDDLSPFNAFAIKIIMSGTNQAYPPIIRDLRAIATVKPQIN